MNGIFRHENSEQIVDVLEDTQQEYRLDHIKYESDATRFVERTGKPTMSLSAPR